MKGYFRKLVVSRANSHVKMDDIRKPNFKTY